LANGSFGRGLLITPTGRIEPINQTNNTYFGVSTGNPNGVNYDNTFFGIGVGANSTGQFNSAFGWNAGNALTTGFRNTLIGLQAGRIVSSGAYNTIVGQGNGFSLTTGSGNTLIGSSSSGAVVGGGLITGNDNIYISSSGTNENNSIRIGTNTQTNNIYIGNSGAAETNVIRIGNATFSTGTPVTQLTGQTRCFIQGIFYNAVSGPLRGVFINSNGELSNTSSSIRFKEDVQDMGDESSKYLNLRPVSFIYKSDPTRTQCLGLIAEEVVNIAPYLVNFGPDGEIQGVEYSRIISPLLNETIKLKKESDCQKQEISDLKIQINNLESRLAKLEALLNVI
jgi:hypothetical protein